jgi:hypothetical protein
VHAILNKPAGFLQRQRHTGGKKWPAACPLRNIWDAVQMLFMSWNAIPGTNWMGMGSEVCSGTWSCQMSEPVFGPQEPNYLLLGLGFSFGTVRKSYLN